MAFVKYLLYAQSEYVFVYVYYGVSAGIYPVDRKNIH